MLFRVMPQFIFEEEREIFPILIPFFSILQYPYNDDDKNSSLSYICKYILNSSPAQCMQLFLYFVLFFVKSIFKRKVFQYNICCATKKTRQND